MNTIEFDMLADTDIMSPGHLELLLRELKRLLRCGALTQVRREGTLITSVDLVQLGESGPWPDIIDEEFVDVQGRRFHLFVDCYHGAGGKWARIDVD